MASREEILAKLPRLGGELPPPIPTASVTTTDVDELWDEFASQLANLGARMVELAEVNGLIEKPTWKDGDVQMDLPNPASIWEAEVGLTMGDVAIANTGSILISNEPGRSRLASLTPPTHIVLIPESRIVQTLEDGMKRATDRTTVIVTGTSRTADIESVLVRGVHGPRELLVLRMRGA